MRHYDDKDEIDLNAKPWQLELLHLNPSYVYWGPHEDYMSKEPGKGWDAPVFLDSWEKFNWGLDELNECANFYFEVDRANKECRLCDRGGYSPKTKKIADDFYGYGPSDPNRWIHNITQDEVDALWSHKRLTGDFENKPTADQVNEWSKKGIGHDGINRFILVETRAKRLGVYGLCSACNGKGYVFTAPEAHVNLVLWMLHPRKGCSRGVEIKIQEKDVPSIMAYLKEAADRNAQRFQAINEMSRVLNAPKGKVALEMDVQNECAKNYLTRRMKNE